MKVKGSILIIILFFIMIGTVGAAENVTSDNLTDVADDINVTFNDQVWEEDLGDINVDLPGNASGEFAVKINDEVIYNQTITNKSFKVPISLPKENPVLVINVFPPIDCRTYKVSAFYNGIDLNITAPLKVMKYPQDYNMLNFPDEVLQGDSISSILLFPRSANGIVEFYIDDRLFDNTTAKPTVYFEENPFSCLSLGNHTFRVVYRGDNYYKPYYKTFNFTVVRAVISIPKVINISHDDCISVETSKDAKGNVRVYIDDRLICDSNTDNGEFILSLEKYIRYTDSEIRVVYSNREFSRTKTAQVNMTYDFDFWARSSVYGMQNTIEIMLPDTLNNNLLTTKINGIEYRFTHPDYIMNNILELDISGFEAGNYSLFVSYNGDEKFYPLNRTYNFTIDYHIITPMSIDYKDSSKVYLRLPANASGDLIVIIDGNPYGSVRFIRGYGEILLNGLNPGRHDLTAMYNGSDYDVGEVKTVVYASPKIDFSYQFTAGEDEYVTVEVPKAFKGYVVFNVSGREYKSDIENGIAKLSLKKLKAGEYEVDVNCYNESGVKCSSNWISFEVTKPKFKFIAGKASFRGIDVKVKLLTKKGKAMAKRKVTVRFNGATYKIKTNAKGILTFKKQMKLKNRKYTLTVTYNGAKFTKKIRAYPIYLKVTKTKTKLIVKAFINKKAKNRIVRFKIKSRTYSVKTNAKGIAKISIKKPKKVPTIKATYLKNTVKF